jgi:hypothetical protein
VNTLAQNDALTELKGYRVDRNLEGYWIFPDLFALKRRNQKSTKINPALLWAIGKLRAQMITIPLPRSHFITCFVVVTQSLFFLDSNFTSEVGITQIWYFEGAEESTRLLIFRPAGNRTRGNQARYRPIEHFYNNFTAPLP